ncbi:MAG: DUF4105 domain-containing protein [Bacteroidales bacterium]|jgi:hypothetical protein|nr:DUF4105 domain-containing protein [Bacteroidales bacterium]
MLKNIVLISLLAATMFAPASAQRLSEEAKISVLTCGPGNELYSTFGHTAIHLWDTNKHLDLVFNYGTFDFNTPNFYVKFSQGRLPYMLSITSFEDFLYGYRQEGRWVYEQELKLSAEEKEKMYNLLIENYLPANRYYAYDFFMDNCATRIRDLISNSLIERSLFRESHSDTNVSFRELIHPYMHSMQWWRLGIDLALGLRSDKPASHTQYMFLPNELMAQLDTTQMEGESFIENKVLIVADSKTPLSKSIPPLLITSVLCVIVILLTVWEHKKKTYFKWLDITLFSLISVLSLLIAYLWFCSNHYTTKNNLNLLWAHPLFIYILLRLRKSKDICIHISYGLLLLCIAGFWFLPQTFNPAVFPVLLLLTVRLVNLIKQKRKLV